MLVDMVETLPERETAGKAATDDEGVVRALRTFSAAMEGDDSLFTCESVVPRSVGDSLCRADFVLRFRSGAEASRQLHFALTEKLVELLRQSGSAEALAARICLVSQAGGLAVQLRLEAQGGSADQARLRWALGLAHVQQALLFASRYLRQQRA